MLRPPFRYSYLSPQQAFAARRCATIKKYYKAARSRRITFYFTMCRLLHFVQPKI
nr:MAG TPA: hypothetical protein [Caudoviricetes sp.]DAJ94853.1 MAG TPA: hypothetical protein [Caudoviricetes sp.]